MKFTIEIPEDVYAKVQNMARIAGWPSDELAKLVQQQAEESMQVLSEDVCGFAMMVEGDSEEDARRIAAELSMLADGRSVIYVKYQGRRFHYTKGQPTPAAHVVWHNGMIEPMVDVCAKEAVAS